MTVKNKLTRNVFYCYFFIVVLFAVIRMLSSFDVFKPLGEVGEYIINAVIQIVLIFATSIFLFSYLQKSKIKSTLNFFSFKKINFKAILISLAIGIIVYILNVFVASFFNSILSALGYNFGSTSSEGGYPFWLFIINIIVTAVLPAICEETAHRGMLLKGLSPMGRRNAIIISSMLFGLLHMNITQFFYATLIGFLLGHIATISDSIYPAMIIHFMNNAISVLMGYSQANNLGFDFLFTYINQSIANNALVGFIFILSLIVLLIILLKYLIVLLFRQTSAKKMNELQDVLFKEIARGNYLKELEETARGLYEHEIPTISFEEFDKLYQNKTIDMGHATDLENQIQFGSDDFKIDKVTKILMIACFTLASIVTIYTLFWGIFLW